MKKISSNLKPKTYNLIRGSLLIESIVAISVLTVGLLSVMGFMSRSLSLNRVVTDQYIASYLAAEGVELVKNIVDYNCLQGHALDRHLVGGQCYEIDYLHDPNHPPHPCHPLGENIRYDPVSGEYTYDSNDLKTSFIRKIRIEDIIEGGDEVGLKVNSIVSWTTRGGGSFSINVEDNFFYWAPAAGLCL